MIINVRWDSGKMTINLDTLFEQDRSTICKLMVFIRDNRYLNMTNEIAYENTVAALKDQLVFYYRATKTAEDGFNANPYGSYAYRRYKRELIDNGRRFRVFNTALNLLENTKISIDERVEYCKVS